MRTVVKLLFTAAILLLWWSGTAIAVYAHRTTGQQADAAIVLGAAAWGNRPSPIFRERINHAVDLYHSGQVSRLIFTGGSGFRSVRPESAVARDYAIGRGVARADILIETESSSTGENLINAKALMSSNGINSLLVVSTPFHMRRAMLISERLQLNAEPSPTWTTRWLRNGSRVQLYIREMLALLYYQLLWQPRNDAAITLALAQPETDHVAWHRLAGAAFP